jgi:hypothetical protein
LPFGDRHTAGASVALRADRSWSPMLGRLAEAPPRRRRRPVLRQAAGRSRRLGVVLATADAWDAALSFAKRMAAN